MKRIENCRGYDIFELTQYECDTSGRIYPTLCIFDDDWNTEETGERDVNVSESEFENLEEARKYCRLYARK